MYYNVSNKGYTKTARASDDYRDEAWKNLYAPDIAYKSLLAPIEKSKKARMEETRRHLFLLVNVKQTRGSHKKEEELSGC